MDSIFAHIHMPSDLKALSAGERAVLCSEIRNFLVDSVSKTGGHLASNLGIVELTVALHTVFDVPRDKIVWDVGHQAYVHKILTGRRERFDTLRQFGGLSGFPKRCESPYDCFDTGHSSTSISAALGMARARDLDGDSYSVISVFGDGALTGGMMYEAMNDAGHSKLPLILILNDNTMSIAKNVGSISRYLRNLRMQPSYFRSKEIIEGALSRLPVIGRPATKWIRAAKRSIRRMVLPTTMFDDLGFEYIGPMDGHDTEKLISVLGYAKNQKKPVFIHICTKKGKGYAPAEARPSLFHGVSAFDKEKGIDDTAKNDYSSVFGAALLKAARENSKIVAITGAMPDSTGLSGFAAEFKDRFFDVGIAEQHGVTLAAGFAVSGYIPVIPLYSSFLQRAYDQILHDVCLQNLHVVFPVDRAGLVGSDGETHQGIYDLSFLSQMPNMTILSPSTFSQLSQMVDYAIHSHQGPIAIRYPRGNTQLDMTLPAFTLGPGIRLREGKQVSIITTGRMAVRAMEAAESLSDTGISCEVLTLPTVKPLDKAAVLASAMKTGCVITLEDNIITGGLGSAVAMLLQSHGVCCDFKALGFPDEPVPHGSIPELDRLYGLDCAGITACITKMLSTK